MADPPSIALTTEHMALTSPPTVIPPLSVPIPPGTNIDDLRIRLFALTTPIRLTGADFVRYWPYVTNLWTRQYKGGVDQYGLRVEVWHCKNSHAAIRPPTFRERKGEAIRHRPPRELPPNCGMKMRLVFFYGPNKSDKDVADWVLLSNDPKSANAHEQHTLDDLDRMRRCKKFMDICYRKTTQGYSPPAITRWLKRAYAGQNWCKHIGRMDVKNAGQLWRAKNKGLEMKQEVEDDDPLPDQVEGPDWLDRAIDEASHQEIKDAIKKLCQEMPDSHDKLLPMLMRWEPDERSPTPPEEVQGGAFQAPDGTFQIVQPRARRDLVARGPTMTFTDPPDQAPRFITDLEPYPQGIYPPAQVMGGPNMYLPQSQAPNVIQYNSSAPAPANQIQENRISQDFPTNQRPPYGQQAQSQPHRDAGAGMPGRPPHPSKGFSTEPRLLLPAPAKVNPDYRAIIHVHSVNPSPVPAEAGPTRAVGGLTQPLFTSRPRWAK